MKNKYCLPLLGLMTLSKINYSIELLFNDQGNKADMMARGLAHSVPQIGYINEGEQLSTNNYMPVLLVGKKEVIAPMFVQYTINNGTITNADLCHHSNKYVRGDNLNNLKVYLAGQTFQIVKQEGLNSSLYLDQDNSVNKQWTAHFRIYTLDRETGVAPLNLKNVRDYDNSTEFSAVVAAYGKSTNKEGDAINTCISKYAGTTRVLKLDNKIWVCNPYDTNSNKNGSYPLSLTRGHTQSFDVPDLGGALILPSKDLDISNSIYNPQLLGFSICSTKDSNSYFSKIETSLVDEINKYITQ